MSKNIAKNLSLICGKVRLIAKRNLPEIMVAVGALGTIVAGVAAVKAAPKAETVMEKHHATMEKVEKALAHPELCKEEYTEKDAKKDRMIIRLQTVWGITKAFAPAVIIESLSIMSILVGHNILKKRTLAITAAFASLDGAFNKYRERVKDAYGEDVDRQFLRGGGEIKETDGEDKEDTLSDTVEKLAETGKPSSNEIGPYTRFFDENCTAWRRDAAYNMLFLKKIQQQANDILQYRGYIFLNEVLKMLALPQCKTGQVVGWIYRPDDKNRDGFVDFGLDESDQNVRDFVNGYDKSVRLDFNVDGIILYDVKDFD